MARTYKLPQVQGTAGISTYATLYSTSASVSGVVSTIAICNTAAASATYRIAIMPTEGTPSAEHWIVYGASVPANETVFLTIGLSVPSSRFIRVSSSANTVTFAASISELS